MPLPTPASAIRHLTAYAVPRHPAPVDLHLDANEGMPVDRAPVAVPGGDALRRYPDRAPLEAQLCARWGVPDGALLVTAGGDDAIDRVCRAVLEPGRNMVFPTPSFEMIPRYATWAGATIREVPWPGGAYPTDAVLAASDARTSLICVVSPNNPTGATATRDDLRRLREGAPHAVILLDHAYVEFADEDLTHAALELGQTVVIRTLSKAWGVAGLRVGAAVAEPALIGWLRAAGNPYTVAAPSLALAADLLDRSEDAAAAWLSQVRAERPALTMALRAHGFTVPESQGNFVFARGPRATWLRDALAGLGVAIRGWPGHPALGDAVRVSLPGDTAPFSRLTDATDAALAPEALLLDMDGVLVDVSGSYRAAIVATCARFGVAVTGDDIAAIKASGNANNDWVVTHRLLAGRGVDIPLADVTEAFEALYQGTPEQPGLKATERPLIDAATLARWAARRPLAVVTGRPRRDAAAWLQLQGWSHLFAAVVCMEDGPLKPDPFPVREALRRLGVSRAWMLGDTPDDARAARAAGVVPIGVVAPGEAVDRATATLLGAGAARVLPTLTALEPLLEATP
jgi:histidinol-phosphate aminotransferase